MEQQPQIVESGEASEESDDPDVLELEAAELIAEAVAIGRQEPYEAEIIMLKATAKHHKAVRRIVELSQANHSHIAA